MKKKSNISQLKKFSNISSLKTKELLIKQASQIEAQKKIMNLWGKVIFWDDYQY